MNEQLVSNLRNLMRKVDMINTELEINDTLEAVNRLDALRADMEYMIKIAKEEN